MSTRVEARTVSVSTLKIAQMVPAKTATRTKNRTTSAQTTAILSRSSRPSAICIGDLPVIDLAFLLLGSGGGGSSLR